MGISLRGIGLAAALAVMAAACGSGSTSPSTGNDGTIATTLTITASGISPKTAAVPLGSRITIVNNDSKSHEMDSDPHPEHTSCPPLNIGVITPGQSRSSQNLTTARACGIHDHSDPDNSAWWATITIQ